MLFSSLTALSTLLSLFTVMSSIWFHPLLLHTEVLYYAGGSTSASPSLSHCWPFLPTSTAPLFYFCPPLCSPLLLLSFSLLSCHPAQHLSLLLTLPGTVQQCLSLLLHGGATTQKAGLSQPLCWPAELACQLTPPILFPFMTTPYEGNCEEISNAQEY